MKQTQRTFKRATVAFILAVLMSFCLVPAVAGAKATGNPAHIHRWNRSAFTRLLKDGQQLGRLPYVHKRGRAYTGYFAHFRGSSRVFKVDSTTPIHFHGSNKVLEVAPRLKVKVNFNERGGRAVKNGSYGYMNRLPQPKRAGYTFKGWYSKKNGRGVYLGTKRMTRNLTSNRTIYAAWTKNVKPVTPEVVTPEKPKPPVITPTEALEVTFNINPNFKSMDATTLNYWKANNAIDPTNPLMVKSFDETQTLMTLESNKPITTLEWTVNYYNRGRQKNGLSEYLISPDRGKSPTITLKSEPNADHVLVEVVAADVKDHVRYYNCYDIILQHEDPETLYTVTGAERITKDQLLDLYAETSSANETQALAWFNDVMEDVKKEVGYMPTDYMKATKSDFAFVSMDFTGLNGTHIKYDDGFYNNGSTHHVSHPAYVQTINWGFAGHTGFNEDNAFSVFDIASKTSAGARCNNCVFLYMGNLLPK